MAIAVRAAPTPVGERPSTFVLVRGGEVAPEEFAFVPASGVRGRRRTVRRALVEVAWAIATLVVLFLALPSVGVAFGYRTLVITSGSMEPTADVGDAVLLEEVSGSEVRVGDVITFRPLRDGGMTTHRVVSIHELEGAGTHFRTKGDGNGGYDPNLVPAGNVVGRVERTVPRVGRAYAFVASRVGRVVFVGIPAALIIASEIRRLASLRRRPPGPKLHSPRRLRRTGPAKLAAVGAAAVVALAVAAPALALFSDTATVGGNAVSSGRVDPPTITNASILLLPCRVSLTWTAPATGLAPDGYDVYRSTSSGGPYSFRKHVGTVTTTTDPASTLTTYYYVLRSTRSAWVSTNSNERSISTGVCI